MEAKDIVRSYTKAGLVLVGISAILVALYKLSILLMLPLEVWKGDEVLASLRRAMGYAAGPALLALFATAIIRSREELSERLCRPVGEGPAAWEPPAYRLAFLAAGMLLVFWACTDLAKTFEQFVAVSQGELPKMLEPMLWAGLGPSLARAFLQVVIGGYLLAGTPGLLAWHLLNSRDGVVSRFESNPLSDRYAAQRDADTVQRAASMRHLQIVIRVGLVLLGVAACVLISLQFAKWFSFCVRAWLEDTSLQGGVESIVLVIVCPLPIVLAGVYLIRNCDRLAAWISEFPTCVSSSEKAAYRFAIAAAGAIIVAFRLPSAASTTVYALQATLRRTSVSHSPHFAVDTLWANWLYVVLQVALGFVLIWAAPRLIRWRSPDCPQATSLVRSDTLEDLG